jgi:hypothetical protein
MTRPRHRLPRWLSVALLVAALAAPPVAAQGSFRITHTVERSPTHLTVTGQVFNDARSDALDVYVTAEAVDAAGKVVASGVSYVGSVAAGSSTPFVIKVPAARGGTNLRVLVSSFRFGFAVQS